MARLAPTDGSWSSAGSLQGRPVRGDGSHSTGTGRRKSAWVGGVGGGGSKIVESLPVELREPSVGAERATSAREIVNDHIYPSRTP